MSQVSHQFKETAPRPPVPGKENIEEKRAAAKSVTASKGSWCEGGVSPAATPRRSALDPSATMQRDAVPPSGADVDPPLGFEPEGSANTTPPFTENSTPPYLRWAGSLRNLLDDEDGVQKFMKFLRQENSENLLLFWFACEGLKKQPPDATDRIQQCIRVIYRTYVRSHAEQAINIKPELRKNISDKVNKVKDLNQNLFNSAQCEVEAVLEGSMYPLFLKSDIYLQHVQHVQNGSDSPKTGEHSSGSRSNGETRTAQGALPTVHEDSELQVETQGTGDNVLPLTTKHLLATRFRRFTEANAGKYLTASSRVPNPYHVTYSSYIPVSAQDSEQQSLSSDAQTDDTLSLTDSSLDGTSGFGRKKYQRLQQRAIQRSARQNRDCSLHHTIIPRTEHIPKDYTPKDPSEFAAVLIDKLRRVQKEREAEEKIQEALRGLQKQLDESTHSIHSESGEAVSKRTPTTLVTKFPLPSSMITTCESTEEDQSILDEHVSRIWDNSAHHTPARSPGHRSPKSKSPDRLLALARGPATLPLSHKHYHKGRKDFGSVLSTDSGVTCGKEVIHEDQHKHIHHYHYYIKEYKSKHEMDSRSLPQFSGAAGQEAYRAHVLAHERQSRDALKRSGGKQKAHSIANPSDAGNLIDSGVSVVSGQDLEVSSIPNLDNPINERVYAWMVNSEKYGLNDGVLGDTESLAHMERESAVRHKRSQMKPSTTPASPSPLRHILQKKQPVLTSRSGSLERGGTLSQWTKPGDVAQTQPMQPVPQEISPNVPSSSTDKQLEEAKKRLEDETKAKIKSSKKKDKKEKSSLSSGVTSTGTTSTVTSGGDYTIIGYYFCGDPVPYRTKLPGKSITLRQFKNLVTKKGNYKYFFKKASDEFGTGVVNEEISDDNEILPFWEGKIFAKVENID